MRRILPYTVATLVASGLVGALALAGPVEQSRKGLTGAADHRDIADGEVVHGTGDDVTGSTYFIVDANGDVRLQTDAASSGDTSVDSHSFTLRAERWDSGTSSSVDEDWKLFVEPTASASLLKLLHNGTQVIQHDLEDKTWHLNLDGDTNFEHRHQTNNDGEARVVLRHGGTTHMRIGHRGNDAWGVKVKNSKDYIVSAPSGQKMIWREGGTGVDEVRLFEDGTRAQYEYGGAAGVSHNTDDAGQPEFIWKADGSVQYEGNTDDSNETTVSPVEPTKDNSVQYPNRSGTMVADPVERTGQCSTADCTAQASCPTGAQVVFGMFASGSDACDTNPTSCGGYCTPGNASCSVVEATASDVASVYVVCG